MDEFVENFQEFRDFLYEKQSNCVDESQHNMIISIVKKFEELGLDKTF